MSVYNPYKVFAAKYVKDFTAPDRILTRPEQQAIAIHKLLSDGEWHTAKAIASHISVKSTRHVNNIMQALKVPMAIASGQQGYTILSSLRSCPKCDRMMFKQLKSDFTGKRRID